MLNIQQASEHIDLLYGSPLDVISSCLRGFLISKPGHTLIAADYASIEARVLAWLAGEEQVLEIFRTHGKIYEHAAAAIYNVDMNSITKEDHRRQVGKTAVLALGYGGGIGAFQTMARGMGVKVSDAEAENIKIAWRTKHRKITEYWNELDYAARMAIENPGSVFTAGHPARAVRFRTSGTFLFCRLPSGRAICYPYPEMQMVDTPWGEQRLSVTYLSEDIGRKFTRHKAYGGMLAENVTQAVSRDLLSAAMIRLEAANYPVVLHVHDEIVCEVPDDFGSVTEMENIMSALPLWAMDLPVSAKGFSGKRYRK